MTKHNCLVKKNSKQASRGARLSVAFVFSIYRNVYFALNISKTVKYLNIKSNIWYLLIVELATFSKYFQYGGFLL